MKRGDTVLPKIAGHAVRWPMLITDIGVDRTVERKGLPIATCFWIGANGEPHFIELAPDLLEPCHE